MLNSEIPVSASARSSVPLCCAHQAAIAWDRARVEASETKVAELEKELCAQPARDLKWQQESITARNALNTLRTIFESDHEKCAFVYVDLKNLGRRQVARNLRELERENARLHAILTSTEITAGAKSTTGCRKDIFRLKRVVVRKKQELAEFRGLSVAPN